MCPVDIDLPALHERLADQRHDSMHVEFRVTGNDGVSARSLHASRTAGTAADHVVSPASVGHQGPWPGPDGPVVLLDAGDSAAKQAWLSAYAAELEAAGWNGTLAVWTQARPPSSFGRSTSSVVTGFAALELAEPYDLMDPRWTVAPSLTHRFLSDAVAWAGHHDAAAYLTLGGLSWRPDRDDVRALLASGVQLAGLAGATYVDEARGRASRWFVAAGGSLVLQRGDPTVLGVDHARSVRDLLLRHAENLDVAFVRVHPGWVHGWLDLDSASPPLPHIEEYHLRLNRGLWSSYVPDAHGIQVLTDAHLEKVADLSAWEVVDLGSGRHLVQAHDLDPWFASDPPPENVLASARRDFGGMLLTPDVIARHRD